LPSNGAGNLPLEMWFSEARDDWFLVGTDQNRQNAINAGYKLMYIDCYVPSSWVTWPSTPPSDSPFENSKDILGYDYMTGVNANYGGADTWYPSWGADNKLYSIWTHGSVKDILLIAELMEVQLQRLE